MKTLSQYAKEQILKDYFSGKSFITISKEYKERHNNVTKAEAEALVYDVLTGIKWDEELKLMQT